MSCSPHNLRHMSCSNPVLLAAFRQQARNMGCDLALLLWRNRPGVHDEDLLRVADEVNAEHAGTAVQLPRR